MYRFLLDLDQNIRLAQGLLVSLELFAVSWTLAFCTAVLLVVVRATEFAPCRCFVASYVEFHRNVPFVVIIFLWYFGVPELLPTSMREWVNQHNSEFLFAAIALGFAAAANLSEDIRSGLRSIPHTQFEAVRALGATYMQAMQYVIVPQALRAAMPALISRAILQFKNTSLAMAVGVGELSYQALDLENETYRTFATFGASSIFYVAGSSLIILIGGRIAARYSAGK